MNSSTHVCCFEISSVFLNVHRITFIELDVYSVNVKQHRPLSFFKTVVQNIFEQMQDVRCSFCMLVINIQTF